MNRYKMILKIFVLFLVFFTWSIDSGWPQEIQTKERIISTFTGRAPQEWGEMVRGVKTRLNTKQKVLALTLDACVGPRGLGFRQVDPVPGNRENLRHLIYQRQMVGCKFRNLQEIVRKSSN